MSHSFRYLIYFYGNLVVSGKEITHSLFSLIQIFRKTSCIISDFVIAPDLHPCVLKGFDVKVKYFHRQ